VREPVLRVLQPDVTKWGGISGNLRIARTAVVAGKRYCPHVFGGWDRAPRLFAPPRRGRGDGVLEFDCHPNAGRELIVGSALPVREGGVPVPQRPGLGAIPKLAALDRYRSWPPRSCLP
jgi:D-galactarolactone cycloisomerase